MSTKKTPKNASYFFCKKCNFKCSKQCDYNRHLNTAKHKNQQNQPKNAKKRQKYVDTNKLSCVCGKSYKDRSGLWRHNKVCRQNVTSSDETQLIEMNDETLDYRTMFLKTMEQNQDLINIISSQTEKNEEMICVLKDVIPKVGNNNVTNNNNNHFNLQVFLNNDCKDAINFSDFIENIKISFEDLEHQAEIGYVNGVSKLLIENLQELGTHKRPIHCTDKKRKTLYIKENDEWNKEGSQNTLMKGIREVSRKGLECLINEKEKKSEEYNDIESEFSEKCLHIQRNILPGVPRETSISKVIEKISQKSGIIE